MLVGQFGVAAVAIAYGPRVVGQVQSCSVGDPVPASKRLVALGLDQGDCNSIKGMVISCMLLVQYASA